MSRSDDLDPWPTCGCCKYGMHRFCLALTTDVFCSCPCGWIWPDGQPHEFWRPPDDPVSV